MNGKTTILIVIIIVLSVLIVYRHENQEEKPPILVKGVNEYVNKEITDRTLASTYFNQFIDMMLSDPDKAYTLLDNTTKENLKVNSKEQFKQYVKKNQNKLITLTLNNFATTTTNGIKN